MSKWLSFYWPLSDSGQQGPCEPYNPWYHNLYIGLIIFPHIDNTESTAYSQLTKELIRTHIKSEGTD